jgi:hypothetical protein
MITREMLDYIALFSKKSLINALKRNDHNGDYKGISKTVAALTILSIVVDNELTLDEMKSMF